MLTAGTPVPACPPRRVQHGFHYFARSLSLGCLCCARNETLAVSGSMDLLTLPA